MGIITIDKSDHLFWLGRYTERVYTTLKDYFKSADLMIDSDPDYYKVLCRKIGIADIYGSSDNFKIKYAFDEADPHSIISSLNRAYDNAIVMRDYIGTETMAYIQLAIDDIKNAENSNSTIADLMLVIDHILAFWGCVNDGIDDEQIRNIIKLGKGIERLDLYLSLEKPAHEVQMVYKRTKGFLSKAKLRYDESVIYTMDNMLSSPDFSYDNVKNLLRKLILS
ncbi:alpha-E domain-containing protein [Candidatus Pseudoruminococcus sp.]|uniref:alpha-E domain-containing protein n=1 Tax=Candidatus Pseudoruminococcus sp. TaxID=3101048 RepID=UPI003999C5BB